MRHLLIVSLAVLLAGSAWAQRGGAGGGGIGYRGGVARGPVGSRGIGVMPRGNVRINNGGFHNNNINFSSGFRGFRNGFSGRSGFYGGYYLPYSYPYWGMNLGYWPDYYDYDWGYSNTANYGYSASPAVTVIYPQAQAQTAQSVEYVERANPVIHEYDRSGKEVKPAEESQGSPIYLLAFKDGVIRAAASYTVSGRNLNYVTLQHEQKSTTLDSLDRDLTTQLNRERRVQMELPR